MDEDIIRQIDGKHFPHNVYGSGGLKDGLLDNLGGVRDVDFRKQG